MTDEELTTLDIALAAMGGDCALMNVSVGKLLAGYRDARAVVARVRPYPACTTSDGKRIVWRCPACYETQAQTDDWQEPPPLEYHGIDCALAAVLGRTP